MTIAQNVRPPAKLIINVFVVVHVEQARATAAAEVQRHGGGGADRTANATSERLPGPLKHRARFFPISSHVFVVSSLASGGAVDVRITSSVGTAIRPWLTTPSRI